MKRILVTGGAGFIGSHLVERLVATGDDVVVLDNLRRGKTSNLSVCLQRIQFIEGDIRDRISVERAIEGCDTVFHLAAQSNVLGAVADIDYSFTTNVIGTFEVLRAAAALGVHRLVFTSSREVYGDPTQLPVPESAQLSPKNAYGASKMAGESYCRALSSAKFQARIVRLANVYGPRDFDRVIPIFLTRASRGETLTLYGGQQILDFIWIETVLDGLIRAAQQPEFRGPVNIGSGKPTELKRLAEVVLQLTGRKAALEIAPARDAEVAKFVADTSLQRKELGLDPPSDPLGNLHELVAHYQ